MILIYTGKVESSLLPLVGLFFLELTLLFFLSQSLTSSLAKFIFLITKSRTATVYVLAILFLPGTISHEIAHFLIASMLFVPTGEIEIFPEIEGDRVRLGSAQIGQTDPLRRMIIGVAPVLVGLAVLISVFLLFKESLLAVDSWWQTVLLLYTVFVIGNTMFSSRKDLEGALALFLAMLTVVLILVGGLYFFNYLETALSLLEGLNSLSLRGLVSKVNYFLLVPIFINLGFLALAKLFRIKIH